MYPTEHGLGGLIFGIHKAPHRGKKEKAVKLDKERLSNHIITIQINEDQPELTFSELKTSPVPCYYCKVFRLKSEGEKSSNIWAIAKNKKEKMTLFKFNPNTKLFKKVGEFKVGKTEENFSYAQTPYIKIPLKFLVDIKLTKCKTFE